MTQRPELRADLKELEMDLEMLPDCVLEEQGVSFKYLVFTLKSGDQLKRVLRGVNFRPYETDATSRILQRLESELADHAVTLNSKPEIDGGGSASVNPYYETVTLFGENNEHGGESDRDAVAELLKTVFPGYQVDSFQPGEEEADPKPKKKAPPRPAAKAAAKTDKSEADDEEETSES